MEMLLVTMKDKAFPSGIVPDFEVLQGPLQVDVISCEYALCGYFAIIRNRMYCLLWDAVSERAKVEMQNLSFYRNEI